MIESFLDGLKDHRRLQGQRYKLKHIILFSIMAILSNSKSYRDIERFIKTHFETLDREFNLNWKKAPGYTTVRNIIRGVPPDKLEQCFREYAKSLDRSDSIVSIAVDGKVLRKSFDNFNDKKAIQILSFFNTHSNIILCHEKIDIKTNEIPVAQKLISEFEIGDGILTFDALHCQKKHFEIAEEKKTFDTA